ncbi:MAG: hypothetical protein H7X97_12150 [Opitutaceae bacterium]|nr:hypothetical protein [Verrucomicrobiales bacterium]
MKRSIQLLTAVAMAFCLLGCASPNSIVKTWKTPTPPTGPVQKVAVVGVDDRALVREGFENRFVRTLRAQSQEAMTTYNLLSLAEINADKKAAKTRLGGAGADAVLIIQLTDRLTNDREVGPRPAINAENLLTGATDMDGWEIYYSGAYIKMGTTWSRDATTLYLNSGLHDLKTGRLLWSAVTKTVVKDNVDRLVLEDALVALVVNAMRTDGMVR